MMQTQSLLKSIHFVIWILGFSAVISGCSSEDSEAVADSQTITESIAIGTDIKTVVKKNSGDKAQGAVKEIIWEDLIPKGFEADRILKKYEKQLEEIVDGSPEEQALLDVIVEEFNNAPSNTELDGEQVKIPGFIAPLDEQDGMVHEFLLVPYFGSCIHSPPPPVNQTVLVRPQKGKSIPIEDIYNPIWVTGKMIVERKETDLAQAGYLIQEAEIELYKIQQSEQVDLNGSE